MNATARVLRMPVPDRLAEQLERSVQAYRLLHRYRRACRAIGQRSEQAKLLIHSSTFAARLKKYENAVRVASRVEREIIDYLRGSL